jgi:hypothetical protein
MVELQRWVQLRGNLRKRKPNISLEPDTSQSSVQKPLFKPSQYMTRPRAPLHSAAQSWMICKMPASRQGFNRSNRVVVLAASRPVGKEGVENAGCVERQSQFIAVHYYNQFHLSSILSSALHSLKCPFFMIFSSRNFVCMSYFHWCQYFFFNYPNNIRQT